MSKVLHPRLAFALLLLAACTTPLDDYVAAPDPAFHYIRHGAVYELTSQTWQGRPWRHWLSVADNGGDTALLWIGGGDNDEPAPDAPPDWLRDLPFAAELRMIPNQPLWDRDEDALVAYAWDQYLRTGDPTWLPRLPMTKAVVRAMDLLEREHGVSRFAVAGASKRGWTAWTVAAVDPRVVAVVPVVIDILNVREQMRHHHAAYGFWAPALDDYREMGLTEKLDTPEFASLLRVVDPYVYRDRYTMPKLLINASGDEFFLPDASQFYFDDLPGPKWLRYVPNTGHSLKGTDARESVRAFYRSVMEGTLPPTVTWTYDGTLRATCARPPDAVRLWQATNPEARDFRVDRAEWAPRGLESPVARVEPPPRGWTAFFIEMKFGEHTVTTPVYVVPD